MLQDEFEDIIDKNSSEIHPSNSQEQLSENNEYYLYDNNLRERHINSLPPIEAYLYFPNKEEQRILNPKNKEDILRYIFSNVKYTSFEEKKLRKLYEEIRKNNNDNKEKNENIIYLPKYWNDSESIRFLQASEFKIPNTIKLIKETLKFNESYYPFQINIRIKYILNSGLMYLCGKDKKFRPIIIIQAKKTSNLLSEEYEIEEIQEAIIYFLNYIIKYHLIPGQIENWVFISDLFDVGISELGNFKKILDIFNKFRGRVYRNFLIRMGKFLKYSLKGILNLVGSSSLKKIKILDKDEIYNNLNEIINPNIIPKIYGGLADNSFTEENIIFPPNLPKINIINDLPNEILSEEEYKIKCLESNDKPYIICPTLKKKWDEEERKKQLIIEEEERKKKLEEERENQIRAIKTLNTSSINEWKKYIDEINKLIIPINENIIVQKYIPIDYDDDNTSKLNIINSLSPMNTTLFS